MPGLHPITTLERYEQAVQYIAENALKLGKKIVGRQLKLDTICFFSQSEAEHAFLERVIRAQGRVSDRSHGMTTYVKADILVAGQSVRLLGVRRPDTTRPEVGYADYPVMNFGDFVLGLELNEDATFMESGNGTPLIELSRPGFDVRGYIVEKE